MEFVATFTHLMVRQIISGGLGNKSNCRGQWNTMDEGVVILQLKPFSMIPPRCTDWLENLAWRK
ncbi:hypothetical protein N7491_000856 [Penicillium cf. griseofulvum]|uniref:Uncharacterized protein n=1 Tax=Penicillium cf. griseofulvum TaxID=2972120 RepID=A0A9W9ILG5_9EURO|nr:hypothetical protein N7472_011263 [Penicillium cf. griseofulvum]KAJ5443018.1 hypothetical protein N7445_004769 [Penicillium cf. griseofulvum]KAJ5451674.1 hypothetical protein N7491_000856 [Penicillium cf. griseofulvum]